MSRPYPVPEILVPGKWTVQSSGHPAVDILARHMEVPLSTSPHHFFIRSHEMVHVLISPPRQIIPTVWKGTTLDQNILSALEETRVNSVLERRFGITLPVESELDPQFIFSLSGDLSNRATALASLAATYGRAAEHRTIHANVPAIHAELFETVLEALWADVPEDLVPPFERVMDLTLWLQDPQSEAPPEPEYESDGGDAEDSGEAGDAGEEGTPTSEDTPDQGSEPDAAAPDDVEESPKEPPPAPDDDGGGSEEGDEEEPGGAAKPAPERTHGRSGSQTLSERLQETLDAGKYRPEPRDEEQKVRWAPMHTIAPRLALPALDPKFGRRRRRSSDEGTIPNAIWREGTDGAIFQTFKKGRSLSILIDGSGSMGLSYELLQAFLNEAPASTISVYRGLGSDGHIIHLAAKSKKITASDFVRALRDTGGGNDVDLPALEWLARQRPPRIWISDGGVISMNGMGSTTCRICLDHCLDHHIQQWYTLDLTLQAIKKGIVHRSPGYFFSRLREHDLALTGLDPERLLRDPKQYQEYLDAT